MSIKITLSAEIEFLKDIVETHIKSFYFITIEIMEFFLTKHTLIQYRVIILSHSSNQRANELFPHFVWKYMISKVIQLYVK